jgi:hypothetical protein
MTWGPTAAAKDSPSELAELISAFQLTQGRVAMPDADYKAWVRRHRKLSQAAQLERAEQLVAIALRFQREGLATVPAVAQLYMMAADCLKKQSFTPKRT